MGSEHNQNSCLIPAKIPGPIININLCLGATKAVILSGNSIGTRITMKVSVIKCSILGSHIGKRNPQEGQMCNNLVVAPEIKIISPI